MSSVFLRTIRKSLLTLVNSSHQIANQFLRSCLVQAIWIIKQFHNVISLKCSKAFTTDTIEVE